MTNADKRKLLLDWLTRAALTVTMTLSAATLKYVLDVNSRLVTLEVRLTELRQKTDQHERILQGDGREGIRVKLARIEEQLKQLQAKD